MGGGRGARAARAGTVLGSFRGSGGGDGCEEDGGCEGVCGEGGGGECSRSEGGGGKGGGGGCGGDGGCGEDGGCKGVCGEGGGGEGSRSEGGGGKGGGGRAARVRASAFLGFAASAWAAASRTGAARFFGGEGWRCRRRQEQ